MSKDQDSDKNKKNAKPGIMKKNSKKLVKTISVKFNAQNIEETYHPHNKTYGHDKINEPDTPFPRQEPPVDAKTLAKKLEKLDAEDTASNEVDDDSDPVSIQQMTKFKARDSFKDKRKKHYANEFRSSVLSTDEVSQKDSKRESKNTPKSHKK